MYHLEILHLHIFFFLWSQSLLLQTPPFPTPLKWILFPCHPQALLHVACGRPVLASCLLWELESSLGQTCSSRWTEQLWSSCDFFFLNTFLFFQFVGPPFPLLPVSCLRKRTWSRYNIHLSTSTQKGPRLTSAHILLPNRDAGEAGICRGTEMSIKKKQKQFLWHLPCKIVLRIKYDNLWNI